MKKIVRISRILKWSALLICLCLPLQEAGYWITSGYRFLEPMFTAASLPVFGERPITWDHLSELQKFLGFLINMLPLSFFMIALSCLSKLFFAFEKLELFEKKNVQILKRAGWALVWGQIIFPLYTAFLSLALTYRNPIGERNLSVSWGAHQFVILAIGLSILLISWVFEEAVKLREEQEATV